MLSEHQIQRYSRQILLREVGGRGQQRLLAAPVEVLGSGPALEVAVAYLAAGGTPVRRIVASAQRARPQLPAVHFTLLDPSLTSGDAGAGTAAPAVVTLAARPAAAMVPGARVAVGRGGVVFRAPGGCDGCFEATALALGDDDAPATAVLLGSLAALAVQRLVLGKAEPSGALRWNGEQLAAMAMARCERHASP